MRKAAIPVLALLLLLAGLFLLLRSGFESATPGRPEQARPAAGVEETDAPVVPEEPSPPAAAWGLRGTVVDADGTPVPGALVRAVPLETDRDAFETASGANGGFEFQSPAAGAYALVAHTDDGRVAVRPLVRVPEDDVAEVVLRLGPGSWISGRVVDPAGAPIVDCAVTGDAAKGFGALYRDLGLHDYSPRKATEVRATTEPDGTFRLGPVPRGTVNLAFSADGLVPAERPGIPAPTEGLTVVLDRAGAIEGEVDAGASPPEEVWIHTEDWSVDEDVEPTGPVTPFRIDGVPAGEYELFAEADCFTRASATVRVVAGGAAGPVRFVIRPGTPVSGVVREAETDRPLAGVEVGLGEMERGSGSWGWSLDMTVTTDEAGRFETRLRPGEWAANLTKAGYRNPGWSDDVFRVGDTPVTVDLRMEPIEPPTHAILGTVRFGDGTPAADVQVGVHGIGRNREVSETGVLRTTSAMSDRTGEDGAFRIEDGVVPWGVYRLEACGPHGGRGEVDGVKFGPGETVARTEITLDRPSNGSGSVTGRVVDEDGGPVAGAVVAVADVSGTTGADGRFRLEDVPAGAWPVRFGAPGFVAGGTGKLTVTEGGAAATGDLVLRRSGLTVEGTVRDTAGRPVSGARVNVGFDAGDRGGTSAEVVTDSLGTYRAEGPDAPSAETYLTVEATGYRTERRDGRVEGSSTEDFTLVRLGEVTATLSLSGAPPDRLDADFSRDGVPIYGGKITWDPATRRLRLVDLPAGPCRIEILATGFTRTTFDVTVRGGGVVDAGAIALSRAGELAGRVLEADGRPIPGARVALAGRTGGAIADDAGAFRHAALPPGEHEFTVRRTKDGDPVGTFTARITAGETTEVTFRLPE